MKKSRTLCALSLLLLAMPVSSTESTLWGKNGEKWDKAKIPDFTRAGYRNGLVPIPSYPVKVNVKELGALGNGTADDTRFFRQAIRESPNGSAILIPAGTYLISDTLQIGKSRLVLRGEGEGKTIIHFAKGLEELYPHYNGSQTDWSWSGSMLMFKGAISDIGIENLTIRFPDKPWAGHDFHERGYNGIGFNGCTHGWARNVTITGADLGLWISPSGKNITVDQWTMDFGPARGATDYGGHHGINTYGGYNMFSNFNIDGKFWHDLSVESGSSIYNVFMQGKGKDICFDHHSQDYNQKYNLFTQIDLGTGSRMYMSGGNSKPRGVSFYETWWNILSVRSAPWITSMGVSTNNVQVGLNTTASSAMPDHYNNWLEAIPPPTLVPQNLYWAQMKLLHNILPPDETTRILRPFVDAKSLTSAPAPEKTMQYDISGKKQIPPGVPRVWTSSRSPLSP